MTPAAFAKLALSLDGAVEGAHGGHADFRVGGKVFATVGYPDNDWGLRGATSVRLTAVDARTMRSALTMAWQNMTVPKPKKARRAAA